jgi:hypothetical protein
MKYPNTLRHKRSEAGVALLIALFALLLISVVGIALVVASGSETSLAGNYRSSANSYYAAMAGVEEGRGRLSQSNPNFIGAAQVPTLTPAPGQVLYVLNPAPGEAAASILTKYPDAGYATEFSGSVYANPVFQNTNSMYTGAANPGPLYKWVRINAVTEASLNINVDNHALPLDKTTALYYDGGKLNRTATGSQAFEVTSLAALPNGSQKVLQYVVAPSAPIPVDAAIHTQLVDILGDALNVTGLVDPVCNRPSTYGVKSGSTVTTPGSGNVTGSPGDVLQNTAFPYNLTALIASLTPSATGPIDFAGSPGPPAIPGTGVTGSGSPKSYSGPHAMLGAVPTVTYDSNGAITKITTPGTPAIYVSPGNLTLGVPTIGGAAPQGQGVLIVKGNLTIDITNGFNYFGLIMVTGDIFMTANPNTSASSNIHGAIIGGGKFTSNLSNLSGSIFIHQNACMVDTALSSMPLTVLSFRETKQ